MVSLLQLAEITEEGVTFSSPVDGTQMLLRPEDSIHHQNRIGSDIIMALDDVAPSTIEVQARSSLLNVRLLLFHVLCMQDPARFREAMERTIRWSLRSCYDAQL